MVGVCVHAVYVFSWGGSGNGTMYRSGKDIMMRLLDKNESRRLGSQSGASQVKQHKWFGKVNWGLLRNTTPPVRRSRLLVHFLFDMNSSRGHVMFVLVFVY